MDFPLKMVIFHSYVSLPEGNTRGLNPLWPTRLFLSAYCIQMKIEDLGLILAMFDRKSSQFLATKSWPCLRRSRRSPWFHAPWDFSNWDDSAGALMAVPLQHRVTSPNHYVKRWYQWYVKATRRIWIETRRMNSWNPSDNLRCTGAHRLRVLLKFEGKMLRGTCFAVAVTSIHLTKSKWLSYIVVLS